VSPSAAARRRRASSRRKRASTGKRTRRDWFALAGKASTLVALVGGVVGLVFTFWPNVKPRPAPAERSGNLSDLVVTPGLTFRQYLERIDQSTGGLDRKTLGRRGALLEFDVGATGYKGHKLGLRYQLLDLPTGEMVGEEQATTVKPEAERDVISWQEFLPFPAAAHGPFRAVVELLDPRGTPLKRVRSRPFRPSR
jgi:hypothetical protein